MCQRGLGGGFWGGSLPETGEADVDEKVGAASGNEENSERWDCGREWSQPGALSRFGMLKADEVRRGRGLTEDGEDDDEDGAKHFVRDLKELM